MSMHCTACGFLADSTARFCRACGSAVNCATPSSAAPVPALAYAMASSTTFPPPLAPAPAPTPVATGPVLQPAFDLGGSDVTTWMKHPLTVGVATLAIAGVAFLSLHHHSAKRLAGADLAIDVEQTIQEQTGYAVTATCDDVPDVKKGAIADCEVFASDGSTLDARVIFDDSAGHFHLES